MARRLGEAPLNFVGPPTAALSALLPGGKGVGGGGRWVASLADRAASPIGRTARVGATLASSSPADLAELEFELVPGLPPRLCYRGEQDAGSPASPTEHLERMSQIHGPSWSKAT